MCRRVPKERHLAEELHSTWTKSLKSTFVPDHNRTIQYGQSKVHILYADQLKFQTLTLLLIFSIVLCEHRGGEEKLFTLIESVATLLDVARSDQ